MFGDVNINIWYKYLGIIEAGLINEKEMKKKFKSVKKKAETKMCARSLLIRYGAGKMGKRRTQNIGFND